jgi:hypothetical protein
LIGDCPSDVLADRSNSVVEQLIHAHRAITKLARQTGRVRYQRRSPQSDVKTDFGLDKVLLVREPKRSRSLRTAGLGWIRVGVRIEMQDRATLSPLAQRAHDRQRDRSITTEHQRHCASRDLRFHRALDRGYRCRAIRERDIDVATIADVKLAKRIAIAVDPSPQQPIGSGTNHWWCQVRTEAIQARPAIERRAKHRDTPRSVRGRHRHAHKRRRIEDDRTA